MLPFPFYTAKETEAMEFKWSIQDHLASEKRPDSPLAHIPEASGALRQFSGNTGYSFMQQGGEENKLNTTFMMS